MPPVSGRTRKEPNILLLKPSGVGSLTPKLSSLSWTSFSRGI